MHTTEFLMFERLHDPLFAIFALMQALNTYIEECLLASINKNQFLISN